MQSGSRYRDREAGLSLIEILVGVSIMATVALAVTLSRRPERTPLQAASDALAARLQTASQEAIISGQPVGLVIEEFGRRYAFYRYVDQRWWPLSDHPALRARLLPETLRLQVRDGMMIARTDTDETAIPVIWFDPAGLTEPFSLSLEGEAGRVELTWQADGALIRRAGL